MSKTNHVETMNEMKEVIGAIHAVRKELAKHVDSSGSLNTPEGFEIAERLTALYAIVGSNSERFLSTLESELETSRKVA